MCCCCSGATTPFGDAPAHSLTAPRNACSHQAQRHGLQPSHARGGQVLVARVGVQARLLKSRLPRTGDARHGPWRPRRLAVCLGPSTLWRDASCLPRLPFRRPSPPLAQAKAKCWGCSRRAPAFSCGMCAMAAFARSRVGASPTPTHASTLRCRCLLRRAPTSPRRWRFARRSPRMRHSANGARLCLSSPSGRSR